MVELQKLIAGDWIDIREKAGNLYELDAHFRLSHGELREQARLLRLAVEEGVTEYKRTALLPVFASLEIMKYRSLGIAELRAYSRSMEALLLVVLIQRLIAMGTITPRPRTPGPEIDAEGLDLQAVLADIRRRMNRQPELARHPAIKNILLQVSITRREREKMKELAPNIQGEMAATFRRNFQAGFARAAGSIRRHYASFLEEEAGKAEDRPREDLLIRLPLRELAPHFLRQAVECARVRSTLEYAVAEKYKTREILVGLYERRRDVLDLVESESGLYRRLCLRDGENHPTRCARELGARFRDELIIILERLARDREKTAT